MENLKNAKKWENLSFRKEGEYRGIINGIRLSVSPYHLKANEIYLDIDHRDIKEIYENVEKRYNKILNKKRKKLLKAINKAN